jgi:hypothetical protein
MKLMTVQIIFALLVLNAEALPWNISGHMLSGAILEKLPQTQRDEMLFMLAARWADEIRTHDKAESHPVWHYVDFPFKSDGEPGSIRPIQPPHENILTAMRRTNASCEAGANPENDRANLPISSLWQHPSAASCRAVVLAGISQR